MGIVVAEMMDELHHRVIDEIGLRQVENDRLAIGYLTDFALHADEIGEDCRAVDGHMIRIGIGPVDVVGDTEKMLPRNAVAA